MKIKPIGHLVKTNPNEPNSNPIKPQKNNNKPNSNPKQTQKFNEKWDKRAGKKSDIFISNYEVISEKAVLMFWRFLWRLH